MSDHPAIPLARMRIYAEHVAQVLQPVCRRIEIGGSIRRGKAMCADIEIVCVPFVGYAHLPGELLPRHDVDHLDHYIRERLDPASKLATAGGMQLTRRLDKNGRPAVGDRYKRLAVDGVPLDLFSVLPPRCKRCGILIHNLNVTHRLPGDQNLSGMRGAIQARQATPDGAHLQQVVRPETAVGHDANAGSPLRAAGVPSLSNAVPGQELLEGQEGLLEELRGETPRAEQSSTHREVDPVGAAVTPTIRAPGAEPHRRLREGLPTTTPPEHHQGQRDASPTGHGAASRSVPRPLGEGAPPERHQARQPNQEPGDRHSRTTPGRGGLSALPQSLPRPLACPRCRSTSSVEGQSWGVIMVIRTGPAEFSQKMVTQVSKGGYLPDECEVRDGGVKHRGERLSLPEEADFFHLCGMAWITPEDRR